MEKKTIGGFIAALRRASGMTQKELAEKLNVSDKSVSRWEREDGAPDLSLIPVIAEIFGVSCDELLRGERRSAGERADIPEAADAGCGSKGEKQRRLLLRNTYTRYTNQTLTAAAISCIGVLCALALNFGALRAYIGFFVGCVFCLAGVIMQAICLNGALASVSDDAVPPEERNDFRRRVITAAERLFALTAILLGFILPLVIFPRDAFVGLSGKSVFLYGSLGALFAGVLGLLVGRVVHHALLARGIFTLPMAEAEVYTHNYRLQRICLWVLAAAIVVTAVAHIASTEIWGPRSLMKGQVFEDYESFIAYMEQDIPYERFGGTAGVETVMVPDSAVYYDENGNEITAEEARRRTLEDLNGNVVCTYQANNETVCSIRYIPQEGTVLPIRVSTYDDLRQAEAAAAMRHVLFCAVYTAEILCAVCVYSRLRKK